VDALSSQRRVAGAGAPANSAAHVYRGTGLRIASEIPLPGFNPDDAGAGAIDATIRMAPVPQALDGATAKGATWEMAGDRFLLAMPDIARFLLTGGREIAVEPAPGVEPAELGIFLIGTVLGILLHQRENIVLHASAVRVGGKAVLFCGASGAGKSTLAAALVRQGFPLVTDDVCAMMFDDRGTPLVQPDGRQLKLWEHAISGLDLSASRGAPVRAQIQKFYVEPGEAFADPLPLGAVYALREPRPPHVPGIERPNVVDCSLLLRRNAYRPLLIRRMGQKTNYFHAAARMTGAAGIFHLTRDLDFAKMPEVIGWLRDHWSELGLLEPQAA